jgi:hypothetical protein
MEHRINEAGIIFYGEYWYVQSLRIMKLVNRDIGKLYEV